VGSVSNGAEQPASSPGVDRRISLVWLQPGQKPDTRCLGKYVAWSGHTPAVFLATLEPDHGSILQFLLLCAQCASN
jgi:hypothetical protein